MKRADLVQEQRDNAAGHAPPVRSLMDIDFYKFTMGQFIHANHPNVEVVFQLILRDKTIPLGEIIDMNELEKSLDHVMSLRFSRTDLYYLRGMDVYGRNMFSEEYLAFLKEFRMPAYSLSKKGDEISLTFRGPWPRVTMWETIALATVSELYYRSLMRRMSEYELDQTYSAAKNKLYKKLKQLRENGHILVADFGQRRRHSFVWQEQAIGMAREILGERFTGSSNTWMAFRHDLIPIGTNAHELPMVKTALSRAIHTQYDLLAEWEHLYGLGLRIMLPDTFGSEQFFRNAPERLHAWRGFRQDSGDPISRGELYIRWLRKLGVDPKEKLIIFSDGLDVDKMTELESHFRDRIKVAFGWGTNFTNDFRDCAPLHTELFRPFSMVCKVVEADGRPCVKLSDNINKATGPKSEVARYLKIFGSDGRTEQSVSV